MARKTYDEIVQDAAEHFAEEMRQVLHTIPAGDSGAAVREQRICVLEEQAKEDRRIIHGSDGNPGIRITLERMDGRLKNIENKFEKMDKLYLLFIAAAIAIISSEVYNIWVTYIQVKGSP